MSTRPFYWAVRRELWENRSIHIAPLVVADVVLFGFLISIFTLPHRLGLLGTLDPARQHRMLFMPYNAVAGLTIMTAFLVGVFYCLDALQSERRDRSILFWKSLPVSDRTTVLSKAVVPLAVLPLLVFGIIVGAQVIMLLVSTLVLLGSGMDVGILWSRLPLLRLWPAELYALVTIALWHAPIYAWLLLVSAWARRAAFLWALLPPVALAIFERIAFGSMHFATLLKYRLIGWFTEGFAYHELGAAQGATPSDPLSYLTPGRFLSTPGLWIGLIFAAAFLAAAVKLRRDRGPF